MKAKGAFRVKLKHIEKSTCFIMYLFMGFFKKWLKNGFLCVLPSRSWKKYYEFL